MGKSVEELAGLKALFQKREEAENVEHNNSANTKRSVAKGKKHQSNREFMLMYGESLHTPENRYRLKKTKEPQLKVTSTKQLLKKCEVSQIEVKGGRKIITVKRK